MVSVLLYKNSCILHLVMEQKRGYWDLKPTEKAQTIGFYRQCGDVAMVAATMNLEVCVVKIVLEVYFGKATAI